MKGQSHIRIKRILSAALVSVMLVTALSGCKYMGGGKEADTTNKEKTSTNSGEPTKFTVAIRTSPNVENFKTNLFTQMVEKGMNVNLEFLELSNKIDEAKTKLSLMISSGTALPDVINGVFDEISAFDYASKGVLVKLDDYYKDPKISPNFNKIPEKDFVYKNLKLSNGSVYSLPGYTPFQWNEGPYRFWINSAWMKKLNLQIPKTTDELYAMLKAFAEKDPNGNGKKDEIGLIGSKDGWAQNPMVYLMNSFIYANADKSYFAVNNGKIITSYTQPEWKQGLEYMNKLVKDGLLSPLSFTQDQTQMKGLVNVKGGMAGAVAAGSYSVFGINELENNMTMMGPVKGPNGVVYTPYNPTLPSHWWFITKDCKNPELAFKVGDFMLSEELSFVSRLGEKGVDWTDDPAVVSQYKGDFEDVEGIKAKNAILNSKFWGNPQNKSWQDSQPVYRSAESGKWGATMKRNEPAVNVVPNFQPYYDKMFAQYFPKEVISKLSYTPEELKKIADIKTTVDAYVTNSAIEFITGNKPFSQWDNYLAELKKMGIDEYVAATQKAYDRTK